MRKNSVVESGLGSLGRGMNLRPCSHFNTRLQSLNEFVVLRSHKSLRALSSLVPFASDTPTRPLIERFYNSIKRIIIIFSVMFFVFSNFSYAQEKTGMDANEKISEEHLKIDAEKSIATPDQAAKYQKVLEELISSEMKQWVQKEIVINAIKEQNTQNTELSEIEFKNLNNTWKTDKRKGLSPLIDRVMNNPLSDYLRKIQDDSQGLYTEIIIIDNKGLNVGSSLLTEDYWHANKPKWQKTLGVKSYAPYISDLHFDDTTELFQIEVSFMIISEDEPIGVAYAGIDVEQLERWKKNKEGL